MLHKTKGIVINYIKYRETSVIARIYTEAFGTQSYIINGIRSPKSKKGLALLQPLTLLEMVVYHKGDKLDGLNRISEYKTTAHFSSIPFDVKKSTMALFITELLSKTLKEEEQHGGFYEYLYDFIKTLDKQSDNYEGFHLFLLVQLSHYLGFGIHSQEQLNFGTTVINETVVEKIMLINESDLNEQVLLSNQERREVLDCLLDFYAVHVEGFGSLNSLPVLTQIFQ